MAKHTQRKLTDRKFSVTGIRCSVDEEKARTIQRRNSPVREKRVIIFKKMDEKERQKVRDRVYLHEIAGELNRVEYLSYAHKREVASILHNGKLSDRQKAEKIRQLF